MAWTSPRTWAVGDPATSADLNTYVRDNTAYLFSAIGGAGGGGGMVVLYANGASTGAGIPSGSIGVILHLDQVVVTMGSTGGAITFPIVPFSSWAQIIPVNVGTIAGSIYEIVPSTTGFTFHVLDTAGADMTSGNVGIGYIAFGQ
ncbi:hypothetical protein K6U06_06650 [Acidiferrimicrobium sp. IK]|uniref:hypothetical protein n=1 Tax=Acidiferrimicrobium sp. IK TaxID=2871700 RepID=UPI0021CB5A98|nr:hypothetical protein [Acidiferrimicrobium sp. IK]MCU4184033.1 hypothetical protein [Acidiferrimicrobium sp. IK]